MKILLSIKPEYVEKIMSGEKKFEYRKSNMKNIKNKNIETVVIYSTMPIGKVVGEFEIKRFLEDTPEKIWGKTSNFSGINKKKYNEYYKQVEKCFVMEIETVKKYPTPLNLGDYNKKIKVAPQSFLYLSEV